MRDAWLPLGLVLIVGSVAPLACGQAFELTGGTGAVAGTGGGSSTGSAGASGGVSSTGDGGATSTSTTTSSSGGGMCTTVADCPMGKTSLCGEMTCQGGKCILEKLQPDGESFSQVYGDCHIAKCTKAQFSNEENNSDVYDDGNECTVDVCDAGTPLNTVQKGNSCGLGRVCNAKGVCVECVGNGANCPENKTVCIGGYCAAATCQNGVQDSTETDEDCGGDACEPCPDGKYCEAASDCLSGVCEVPPGGTNKKCATASCVDTVKNANETDTDCGGPDCQMKCPSNAKCQVGADCMDGVCKMGACQDATCFDGVKNGSETVVDCGGSDCVKCPGG